ncbi:hypothetical protein DID88_000408 [Monilinia fructigena]|uniref:Uncharacterized protein n=1 Tax=Monilinia fructigena TaxID=38457 RepID=A0A395IN21_9HELO|nr:hypothetical protein DID88_000408 [Monilinia fructigena]
MPFPSRKFPFTPISCGALLSVQASPITSFLDVLAHREQRITSTLGSIEYDADEEVEDEDEDEESEETLENA